MKTTIDIPEPLYQKVKTQAIESGQTLKQIVLASLERDLAPPPAIAEAHAPYWANRQLLPEFRKHWESGDFSGGTDSTRIISEDRDPR
jgi:hypothetical protein